MRLAIFVLSDPKSGSEESLGRLFNALSTAHDANARGDEVALVFLGAGTRWPETGRSRRRGASFCRPRRNCCAPNPTKARPRRRPCCSMFTNAEAMRWAISASTRSATRASRSSTTGPCAGGSSPSYEYP